MVSPLAAFLSNIPEHSSSDSWNLKINTKTEMTQASDLRHFCFILLSLRGMWIETVWVLCPNGSISTADYKLTMLVPCNFAGNINPVFLSWCAFGRTRIASAFHLPAPARMRSHELIFAFCQNNHPFIVNEKSEAANTLLKIDYLRFFTAMRKARNPYSRA